MTGKAQFGPEGLERENASAPLPAIRAVGVSARLVRKLPKVPAVWCARACFLPRRESAYRERDKLRAIDYAGLTRTGVSTQAVIESTRSSTSKGLRSRKAKSCSAISSSSTFQPVMTPIGVW